MLNLENLIIQGLLDGFTGLFTLLLTIIKDCP